MTFPLLPIVPQQKGAMPDATPITALNPEHTPFTLFVGLQDATTNAPTEDVLQDVEAPSIKAEQDESNPETHEGATVEVLEKVDIALSDSVPEKHPQTLLETAFAPGLSAGTTSTGLPNAPQENTETNRGPTANLQRPDTAIQTLKLPENPQQTGPARTLSEAVSAPQIGQQMKATAVSKNEGKPQHSHAQSIVERQNSSPPTISATALDAGRAKPTTRFAQAAGQPILLPQKEVRTETSKLLASAETRTQPTISAQPPLDAAAKLPSALPALPIGNAVVFGSDNETVDTPFIQSDSDVQASESRAPSLDTSQRATQTPQLAKSIAHQMAVAVSQTSGGTTEITLSPDELGRVRMVMSTQEGGISVLIHTERPETNDLLRRHIETLSQEFKDMGYSTASFTFAQNHKDQSAQEADRDDAHMPVQDESKVEPQSIRPSVSAGLDLRL